MSPLLLRRYRAERLLRQEFDGLRTQVLGVVRGRLRARGVQLDNADLEACYATAWQGLYATVLDGEEVANRAGWLVLVTFRRAIDEHRSRLHEDREELPQNLSDSDQVSERDLAQRLDDRDRLRHLFEGFRGRLNARECQAASLCYLQGLSRSQAAAQMGISEARLRKLMEGDARKGPGVAGKVGELLDAIRADGWCEQQASLMRALAYGILDPDGERYRLAQLHRRECPACRAYVRSLRGLAAVLPPVALPWGLPIKAIAGAGAGAGAGSGGGAGAAAGGGVAAGAGGGAGAGAVSGGVSAGALSASGVAGVGGAGGGWLLAGGSVGAKLAVGCLLALSFGAGCVALTQGHRNDPGSGHRHALAAAGHRTSVGPARLSAPAAPIGGSIRARTASSASRDLPAATDSSSAAVTARKAQREFGLEGSSASTGPTSSTVPTARPTSSLKSSPPAIAVVHRASAGSVRAARREFGAG